MKTSVFLFLAASLLGGCDIVQGFRDASDAIFPAELSYLDAPGFHLVHGQYRDLNVAAGSELYLLMRSSAENPDDPAAPRDTSLYAARYANPKPCAIPNVGSFRGGEGKLKGPALIAYYNATPKDRILRFADGECKTYPLTIPEGSLRIIEVEQGLVIQVGSELLLVNPVAGTTQSIVKSVEQAYLNQFGELSIVKIAGQLRVFRSDWISEERFGDRVVAEAPLGEAFYYEDSGGIHRLTSSDGQPPTITDELIGPGGYHLGIPRGIGGSESWVTFFASQADPTLMAYGHRSKRASRLGLPPNVDQVLLLPAWPKTTGDPTVDPFYVFYLMDLEDSPRTLCLRTPSKAEYRLGSRAVLDRVTAFSIESGTHGYALVDEEDDVGRFLWWDASDGSTKELAPRALNSTDVVLNPDLHVAGDFALPNGAGLTPIAGRVPLNRHFKFSDSRGRWTALFDQCEGDTARLSVTESSLDFYDAAGATEPLTPPTFSTIAEGVWTDSRTRFLKSVPGVAFFTRTDEKHDTGLLQYRNLQLGFTAVVNDGVSDYIPTSDTMIYTVPFGPSAGVWVARAR